MRKLGALVSAVAVVVIATALPVQAALPPIPLPAPLPGLGAGLVTYQVTQRPSDLFPTLTSLTLQGAIITDPLYIGTISTTGVRSPGIVEVSGTSPTGSVSGACIISPGAHGGLLVAHGYDGAYCFLQTGNGTFVDAFFNFTTVTTSSAVGTDGAVTRTEQGTFTPSSVSFLGVSGVGTTDGLVTYNRPPVAVGQTIGPFQFDGTVQGAWSIYAGTFTAGASTLAADNQYGDAFGPISVSGTSPEGSIAGSCNGFTIVWVPSGGGGLNGVLLRCQLSINGGIPEPINIKEYDALWTGAAPAVGIFEADSA